MERKLLTSDEIVEALKQVTGWREEDGHLKKRFTFENFAASLAFVNQVGAVAEAADHHPDINFGWGYAEFAITTHDRGGITDVDLDLAANIDAVTP